MNISRILRLPAWDVFALWVLALFVLSGCAGSGAVTKQPPQTPLKTPPVKTLPTVSLSVDVTSINEKTSPTRTVVTTTLSAPSEKAVKVTLKVSGSATALYDYTLPLTLTIPAGKPSASAVLVALDDDPMDEADEMVIFEIENATHAVSKMEKPLMVKIVNESPLPTVELSVKNSSIHEKTAPTSTDVTATLSAVGGRDVTVELVVSGTAASQTDHTLPKTVTLTIPAGKESASVNFAAKNDDPFDEENETVVIDIGKVVNGTELQVQQEKVTLVDESPLPTVTLLVGNENINEKTGIASTVVQASLSAISAKVVTVTLTPSGTASAEQDYTLPLEIKIPAGLQSAAVILSAMVDTGNESEETVIVDISSVQNGVENRLQQTTVIITDQ